MIILPIFLPLFLAVICLLAWNYPYIQRWVALLGSLALVVVSGWILLDVSNHGLLVLQSGNWPAPFGITLAVDGLSAIMVLLGSLVGLVVAVYAAGSMDMARLRFGFYPLFFILLMGVNGAFTTGDLFNLYVWFEVMLMASFVLMALGGERQQIEGAVKYLILNLLASMLFLSAIGLTYNLAGTLNLADLAVQLNKVSPGGMVTLVSILFLVAFGIKSAIFPLFFWLPASYHTPPVAVTALFSGLLTKVGVYSLIRVFTLLFTQDTTYTHTILLVLAGFTMVTGVFGAAAQLDFRRLLSFHIVSQIGYLIMGLGLMSREALAGTIYFMGHVILAKTALFLIAGLVERMQGSYDLKKLGGIYRLKPAMAVLFLLPAMSLAGLPPLSGFFAKLILVAAGLRLQQYAIVAAGLFVSLLTLYSMTKVWNEVFWKEPKQASPEMSQPDELKTGHIGWMWAATIGTVVLMLAMTVFADPMLAVADRAASQLLSPDVYISAVLRGGR